MPSPGDVLADRYRIESLLGAGGMATVHRAHDERLGRDVAVKVLLPNLAGDPILARRFEREARAMAAVADPGLVAVFDVDPGDPEHGREPFVVMELCTGGSLADRLGPDRPMPPDELIPILVAVSNALGTLHRSGLVHRDVKPSNILFSADRAKLGDFGLVRSGGVGDATDLTEPGTAMGTLGYLAPERLGGDPGGPAADIYALGTVAYLGLTGRMPRPTGSVRDIVASAAYRPPAVSTVAPDRGREFDEILFAALALDPARRPDALALGSGLATALGRWTRSGRPGAVAAPAVVGFDEEHRARSVGESLDDVAIASVKHRHAADDPSRLADEPTTALALAVGPTATVGVDTSPARSLNASGAAPRPVPARDVRPRRASPRRRVGWLPVFATAAAVVFLILAGRSLLLSAGGAPGVSALPSQGRASAVIASPSIAAPATPTATPSPTPRPSVDPALSALDAVDAAIAAARGGPDGLKGKEANELESQVARVRHDLASGDRAAALRDARALDRRARDAADHLHGDAASRLTSATARLLDALGG